MTRKKPLDDSSLEQTLEDLTARARAQLGGFEDELLKARNFVKKNPLISMLAVAFAGYLVGRLLKKERVVYVEKSDV